MVSRPSSTDKGPEHVEIRLKDAADAQPDPQPEVVYVTEYVDTPRRELTAAEQARADSGTGPSRTVQHHV